MAGGIAAPGAASEPGSSQKDGVREVGKGGGGRGADQIGIHGFLRGGTLPGKCVGSAAPAGVTGPSKRVGARLQESPAVAGSEAAAKIISTRQARRETMANKTEPKPGRLGKYLQRRRRACAGLQQALELERLAFAIARDEYARALSEFEADHTLEITRWGGSEEFFFFLCPRVPLQDSAESLSMYRSVKPGGGDRLTRVLPPSGVTSRCRIRRDPGVFFLSCSIDPSPVAGAVLGPVVSRCRRGLPLPVLLSNPRRTCSESQGLALPLCTATNPACPPHRCIFAHGAPLSCLPALA